MKMPNLYELVIEIVNGDESIETVSKKVGIMHSKVVGNKFCVNESPVYIKGIARHEYDCRNGRAIGVEQIEKELRMKKIIISILFREHII